MPVKAFNSRYFIAILVAILLLAASCKKAKEDIQRNVLQEYFETNLLNRDFVVHLATDTAVDITTKYTNQFFKLYKGAFSNYEGPMTGIKSGTVYTGTWSSNEDYSKLTINLNVANAPAEYQFLNRPWRFSKKALPIMELSPWGSTDPKVLHMRRL